MQRVIVTGGLGFIGSHVVDGLLAAGRQVTVIDSMVAAVTDGREYEEFPGTQVHRVSISDFLALGGTFEGSDLVVHAASHVGPASILQRHGSLGAEIVAVTQEVIEECVEHDVPLISFSSAEVYGRSGMLAESDDIIVPTHYNARLEYAIAKTLTEAATINSRHRGLRAFVIRPFNVAGPRQSRAGGFVMPTFVQQALAEQPLTVFAAACRSALSSAPPTSPASSSTTPKRRSSRSARSSTWATRPTRPPSGILAERIVERLDSSSPIEHADAQPDPRPAVRGGGVDPEIAGPRGGGGRRLETADHLDELIDETAYFYSERDDTREAAAVPLAPHVGV